MDRDTSVPLIIKAVGAFMIFIGVIGTISSIYSLTLVNEISAKSLSTRDASKSILDASVLLTKDKNTIKTSISATRADIKKASVGLNDASSEFSSSATSLDESSNSVGAAADSLTLSAESDREAASEIKAAADAMDSLWGPTQVAISLRGAADKMDQSADNMETTSIRLKEASTKTKDASLKLMDSSLDIKTVSDDLNNTQESLDTISSSVDSLTQRLIGNLNDLVTGFEWFESVDKKTILYELIIYFLLVHLIFIGSGTALILISVNLYG